jgi:WhiB family redox-sensing transcriptional regulator
MGDRQRWRGQAACAGLGLTFDKPNSDFFFILPGQKARRAKTFCSNCPVKRECLEFALIYNEDGIWGGTTKAERDDYPSYIVDALRAREYETVGMESRNLDDFIPRQYSTNSVVHQVTTIETENFQVTLEYYQESREAPGEVQLEVLDRLFARANDLLQSVL